VLDVVYVVGTIVFFLLMLAYTRGCERLGKRHGEEVTHEPR
jgi:hypothetical protein